MITYKSTIEDSAKEYAGNHAKFTCFVWYEKPEDSENWAIVYTHNRDSGPLDRANAVVIAAALAKYPRDAVAESHNHWAVGHVDGFRLRVYRRGRITPAFKAYFDLMQRMDDYPILDESVHSRIVQDEIDDSWTSWARDDFERELASVFGDLDVVTEAPGQEGGQWIEPSAQLFDTGARSVYRYHVPNGEAAFLDLFDRLRERSNTEWNEDNSGVSVNIKRIVDAATEADVKPFLLEQE